MAALSQTDVCLISDECTVCGETVITAKTEGIVRLESITQSGGEKDA